MSKFCYVKYSAYLCKYIINDMKDINDHCRKYLPHIENKSVQMITFRLADSVPGDVIEQWKSIAKDDWEKLNKKEYRRLLILIDKYEDAGIGECLMRDDRVAEIIKHTLLYSDKKMYELICWCIMPNHVHVLLKMLPDYSLSEILFSWRSYSSHAINKHLNRIGNVWMREYFDRYIRNQEHFKKAYNYILNNPLKAGLVSDPYKWRWSSIFDEEE